MMGLQTTGASGSVFRGLDFVQSTCPAEIRQMAIESDHANP